MQKRYVGTSGWTYAHWKNRFYPGDLSSSSWLSFYAKHFSTVEVNATFYRTPGKKTFERWFRQTPADFLFTLKMPRTITHLKQLKQVSSRVKRFYAQTKPLGRKRACFLTQLPPRFQRNENTMNKLKTYLKVLDGRKNNVIEFRHQSWWSPEVYDLLDEHHTTFCSVAGQSMPDQVVLQGKLGYVRFHGNNYQTNYHLSTLKAYAKKIAQGSSKKVFAYFNNDANAYAPKNAQQLQEVLDARAS